MEALREHTYINYNRLNGVIKRHSINGLKRDVLLMLNEIVLKPHLFRKRKMIQ